MKLIFMLFLINSIPYVSAQCLPSAIQGKGIIGHKELNSFDAPYGFVEYLPPKYKSSNKKWPLIIMLHGVGERGNGQNELSSLFKYGPLQRILNGREFPAIILTPQTSGRWSSQSLMEFLEYAFENYSVDRSRVYMTGLSMGGGGTWEFIRSYPNVLAAALPICGAAKTLSSTEEGNALTQSAIYAVHNMDDDVVNVSSTVGFAKTYGQYQNSRNEFFDGYHKDADMTVHFDFSSRKWMWSNKSRAVGPQMKYTVALDRTGGHDSWSKTYESEATWEWLFCQIKFLQ